MPPPRAYRFLELFFLEFCDFSVLGFSLTGIDVHIPSGPELVFLPARIQTYPFPLFLLSIQCYPDFRLQLTSPSSVTFSLASAPLHSHNYFPRDSLVCSSNWVTYHVLSSGVYVFKMEPQRNFFLETSWSPSSTHTLASVIQRCRGIHAKLLQDASPVL